MIRLSVIIVGDIVTKINSTINVHDHWKPQSPRFTNENNFVGHAEFSGSKGVSK